MMKPLQQAPITEESGADAKILDPWTWEAAAGKIHFTTIGNPGVSKLMHIPPSTSLGFQIIFPA